jgi:hypothetical protein
MRICGMIALAGLLCAIGGVSAQDRPPVNLRDKKGIPRDFRENDPKPPRIQRSEPPPPAVPKPPERVRPFDPKGVAATRG